MDYETYDFGKMQKEYLANKKEILCQTPSSPKWNNITNIWQIQDPDSIAAKIKRNNIIYFYVHNLESQSKKKTRT